MTRIDARNFRPLETETEMYAMLFSMLGNAYAELSLHQKAEREREQAADRAFFDEAMRKPPPPSTKKKAKKK